MDTEGTVHLRKSNNRDQKLVHKEGTGHTGGFLLCEQSRCSCVGAPQKAEGEELPSAAPCGQQWVTGGHPENCGEEATGVGGGEHGSHRVVRDKHTHTQTTNIRTICKKRLHHTPRVFHHIQMTEPQVTRGNGDRILTTQDQELHSSS